MSTSNLSRTISEGDRSRRSRSVRRQSSASERAWARVTSHELLTASELDAAIYRPREKVYRDFSDELSFAARLLQEF